MQNRIEEGADLLLLLFFFFHYLSIFFFFLSPLLLRHPPHISIDAPAVGGGPQPSGSAPVYSK